MPELTIKNFSEFFEELWECPPFKWQQGLAERVLSKTDMPWPKAIKLPTASGKTACIDIAIFALAMQANQLRSGNPLTAPRRVFFVVDRRIIVDEAFERATKLADKLREAKTPLLSEVAQRLRYLSGGKDALACYQLRGGMYRSDAWAHSPDQPAVIVSTVDQLGSRLLFRAYGCTFKAWPIQAGLAGNDALIILDEAHCAQPFMETLHAVSKYRQWGDALPKSPFYITVMSATPPDSLKDDVFLDTSLEPRTPGHPLGDRQRASKLMEIVALTDAEKALSKKIKNALKGFNDAKGDKAKRYHRQKFIKYRTEAAEKLAVKISKKAEELVNGNPLAAVVFVNRVATARRIYKLLLEKHKDRVILLTGRMRPIDKDNLIKNRLDILSASRSLKRRLTDPMFVVATQTLEVGANLDFDVLVTECASLDALRQRFGRLNRMGRNIEAKAAVVTRADQAVNSKDDPVYGAALAETWKWINKQSGKAKRLDMGIAALDEKLSGDEELAKLNSPLLHAPVMLPSHIDCWVQTFPEPMPIPDISMFLHGPGRASADVQVCWRSDLPLEVEDNWLDILTYCPPSAPECLPVPIYQFRKWLAGDFDELNDADVEGIMEAQAELSESRRKVIRWCGRNDVQIVSAPNDIHPGDIVVIPEELGGWDVLGDFPLDGKGKIILDWGDRAHRLVRAKAVLRLNDKAMANLPELPAIARLRQLARNAPQRLDTDPEELVEDLKERLKRLAEDISDQSGAWLKEIAANLVKDKKLVNGIVHHPAGGLIICGSCRLPTRPNEADDFSDEDDASASSGVRHIPLIEHLEGVAALSKRFAGNCGLKNLIPVLEIAGRRHDLGKADPRFQAWLKGGNPWARGELLAKSKELPRGRKEIEWARERAGYPKGGRHELLSACLLKSIKETLPKEGDLNDLIMHLVESHHGYCRPFAPVVEDNQPVSVMVDVNVHGKTITAIHSSSTCLERLDSGVAERFWRLTRRYGWWGLAWIEAILRLADHRQSEAESRNDSGGGDL